MSLSNRTLNIPITLVMSKVSTSTPCDLHRRCSSFYPCQTCPITHVHEPCSEAINQREPPPNEIKKVGLTTHLCRGDDPTSQQLWYNEQTNKPSPSEQPKGQVMPKRHERKHQYGIDNCMLCPAKGHINVPITQKSAC